MAREGAGDEELTQARDARVRLQRIERLEVELCHLGLARRARIDNGRDTDMLDRVIRGSKDDLDSILHSYGGRMVSRKRPQKESDETCTIYVDECGGHSIVAKDKFEAFSLAAVIIRDSHQVEIDRQWSEWKGKYLGSAGTLVHEPDLRKGNGSFFCNDDKGQREAAMQSLRELIPSLPFTAIVCVLNRLEYRTQYGDKPLDESLPKHPYLMTLDFVLERAVMALEEEFDGAKAHLVIESRGPREDAAMQYEFARLFLDGTSYVSDSYFRHQLFPGVEFQTKKANSTGLQLADLLARPCAEKVLNPDSTPPWWPEFRPKLCAGHFTGHSILGLKVVPWDEKYDELWKS
jgi:hypothetical protein